MIDKIVGTTNEALEGITDGATLLVGGFGDAGVPNELLDALVEKGVGDLTVVSNNAGVGDFGLGALMREGRVKKVICSFPRSAGDIWFSRRYELGEVELELVPQGTLTERIRAAGAGIGAFYTPTAIGTSLSEGKEIHRMNDRDYVLEHALDGDFALIKAKAADRWGNLVYHAAARNYAPTMAMAGTVTIAQVQEIVEVGALSPEEIITPGIFVDRVIAF